MQKSNTRSQPFLIRGCFSAMGSIVTLLIPFLETS
jgi:hypothetical protein